MALSHRCHRPKINNLTTHSTRVPYSLPLSSLSRFETLLISFLLFFRLVHPLSFRLSFVLFVVDRNNSAELFVRHDSIRAFLSYLISDLTYPLRGCNITLGTSGMCMRDEGYIRSFHWTQSECCVRWTKHFFPFSYPHPVLIIFDYFIVLINKRHGDSISSNLSLP